MEDRGNKTTNHRDHIHFSFSWNGALRASSYWTGESPAPNFGWCANHTDQFAPAGGRGAAPDRDRPCTQPTGGMPRAWVDAAAAPIVHGDTGPRVESLSRFLRNRGYETGVVGYYDGRLYEAVRAYQADAGITPTGVWDAETQHHTLTSGR